MDSFARLRSKFLASKSFNSKSRPSLETQDISGIHLPYLVCLLQTAGYHLGKVDCVNPKYMNKKGTTIELSCGYSGQRCSLYRPEEQDKCNCFIKGEDSNNFFLEAVSQGHLEERWLVANGNTQYCLPFISDDLKLLCKTVMMELVTLMKESYKSMNAVKMCTTQNDSGFSDNTIVAVPQKSQGITSMALDTRKADQVSQNSTFVLQTEMSRNLQKQTVIVNSSESSFTQSSEHKSESWKMSTSASSSAISVVTESISQTSSTSTILKSPKPQTSSAILKSPKPQTSSAILKSPKPSPVPVKNVQKVNNTSTNTKNSVIPKTPLGNKGNSTSNLKVLGGNVSASKDHHSPLSISNSKSTPNLLISTAGNNKNAGSHQKAVISNMLSSPARNKVTPQVKTPTRTKLTTSSGGPPRPATPRKTPLKNTSLKIPVRGTNVASTGKCTSPSVSINSASSTIASRYKKTTTVIKEKSEKVVQVTARASGCFACKK